MDCEKKSFTTKKQAVKRIGEIKSEEGGNVKPIRSYLCDKCGKFHLTSWSKKKKGIIENTQTTRQEKRIEALAEYWIRKKKWNV